MPIDWAAVATKLKYESETVMWYDLYIVKGIPTSELAERFGISRTTIRDTLRRCSIEVRGRGGCNNKKAGDPDLLASVEKDGVASTAKRLGITTNAVYMRLKKLRGEKKG